MLVVRDTTVDVQGVYRVIREGAVAAHTTCSAASAGQTSVCVVGGLLYSLLSCQTILLLGHSLLYFLSLGKPGCQRKVKQQIWSQGAIAWYSFSGKGTDKRLDVQPNTSPTRTTWSEGGRQDARDTHDGFFVLSCFGFSASEQHRGSGTSSSWAVWCWLVLWTASLCL